MSHNSALPSGIRDRVRGMILGAAVGDALGWPQEQRSGIVGGQRARRVSPRAEFRAWERNSGTSYSRYRETVNAGDYSDDTQMLLAVARACLRDDWRQWLRAVELPAMLLYERGAGHAVLTAARTWAAGAAPWAEPTSESSERDVTGYYNAGANGVAMRIAAHVVITAAQPSSEPLIERVVQDGICTHGHPRALVGAVLHALALRHALLRRGTLPYGELVAALLADPTWENPDVVEQVTPREWVQRYQQVHHQPPTVGWKRTVEETRNLLEIAAHALDRAALASDEDTLAELGCFDPSRNGAGHITAVAAAYSAARAAARPMTGLLLTAFLSKADTDTLASMTASLLGAVHGIGWNERLAGSVQDAQYLNTIADQITIAGSSHEGTASLQHSPDIGHDAGLRVTRLDIDRFRHALDGFTEHGTDVLFDGRRFSVISREQLASSGKNVVTRWRLGVADGQTLIVDRIRRVRTREPVASSRRMGSDTKTSIRKARDLNLQAADQRPADLAQMTLVVRDLDRSLRFYRDVLGLSVQREDKTKVRVGAGLLLMSAASVDEAIAPVKRVLFTIRTNDLLSVWQAARDFDVEVLTDRPNGENDRIRLRDPDGIAIIVQSR